MEFVQLLQTGIPVWIVLSWMVFCCAVQALPRPTSASALWYIFLYRFMHGLSMNIQLFLDPTNRNKKEPNAPPLS